MRLYVFILWLLSLNEVLFGQAESVVAVDASRKSVLRYEQYSDPLGKRQRTADTMPVKVSPQKCNTYLGSFYNCMFGQVYAVEASQTGEILTFKRLRLVTETADTPDTPKWTKEEAAAEARQFVIATTGKWPRNLGVPSAIFKTLRVYGGKYEKGEWHVHWPRVDEQGHLFFLDGVNVVLSESKGGIYVSANLTSKFTEKNFQPKERKEALKLALEIARKKLEPSPSLGELIASKRALNEVPISEGLFVVRPNRYLVDGSTNENPEDEARLAWAFSFGLAGKEGRGLGGIVVWIDAENGKCIAGDSF